jgi:hypothetical protein
MYLGGVAGVLNPLEHTNPFSPSSPPVNPLSNFLPIFPHRINRATESGRTWTADRGGGVVQYLLPQGAEQAAAAVAITIIPPLRPMAGAVVTHVPCRRLYKPRSPTRSTHSAARLHVHAHRGRARVVAFGGIDGGG